MDLKTFGGNSIDPRAKGIVYLCEYTHAREGQPANLKVCKAIQFGSKADAFNAYANIPNPESQMAAGNTREEFEKDLEKLHKHMRDPKWVDELGGYL